jgi:hypothetical protein
MTYRRDNRELINKNVTRYVSEKVDDDASWILDSALPSLSRGRDIVFDLDDMSGARQTMAVCSLSHMTSRAKKIRTLLLSEKNDRLKEIKEVFKSIEQESSGIVFLDDDKIRNELKRLRFSPVVAAATAERFIDHLRRDNLDLSGTVQVVFDVLHKDADLDGYMKDISFIFTKLPGKIQKIVFVSESDGMEIFLPLLHRPKIIVKKSVNGNLKDLSQKETKGMSDILTDSMQSAIELMIKQVKEKEEPELLADYKKLFKKSVPLMVRPWVTAYLFKEALARYSSTNGKRNVKDGVNIFVGVGKKRKVYPKDLIQLFIEKGKISREDIGDIKILDSYSFVMIKQDSADKLIKNMNGLSFRGRKLNVNYAKKK